MDPVRPHLAAAPMGRLHRNREYRALLLEEGIKPVIRISNLDREETAETLAWFRERGFVAAPCHAEYGYGEKELYEFDEDKGGLRYIFASKSEECLQTILAADLQEKGGGPSDVNHDATRTIGRMLGYPTCCTESLLAFPEVHHQSTFLLRPLQETAGDQSPYTNPSLRLQGHFACSYDCAETIVLGRRAEDALLRRMPEFGAWVQETLRCPTLFLSWDCHAVLRGARRSGDRLEFDGMDDVGLPVEVKHALRGGHLELRGPLLVGEDVVDLRAWCVHPYLFEPGAPAGRGQGHIAVVDGGDSDAFSASLRVAAGDLSHVGYWVDYHRAAPTTAKAACALIDPRCPPSVGEAFVAAGVRTWGPGGQAPLPLRGGLVDREAVVLAIEGVDGPTLSAEQLAARARRQHWPLRIEHDPEREGLRASPTLRLAGEDVEWMQEQLDRAGGSRLVATAAQIPALVEASWPDRGKKEIALDGPVDEALLEPLVAHAEEAGWRLAFPDQPDVELRLASRGILASAPPLPRRDEVERMTRWLDQRLATDWQLVGVDSVANRVHVRWSEPSGAAAEALVTAADGGYRVTGRADPARTPPPIDALRKVLARIKIRPG